MKLLSLKLENFRCFETCELDLNVDGLIGVVGPNGAGKSTLFGAVEWAFYGSQRGPRAFPAIRDGAGSCRVELEFALGEHQYHLLRTHKTAELRLVDTDLVLATTATATSEVVAATLGMSRDAFLSTFYARQRELQALDVRDSSRRRTQLERLLGIERLRRACELARAQAHEQQLLVSALEEQCADIDEALAELRQREDEARQKAPAVEAANAAWAAAKARRETARHTLSEIRTRADSGRERQAKSALAQAAAEQAAKERLDAQEQLERAQQATAQLEALTPIASRRAELAARERELALARTAHERAQSLRDEWHTAQAQVVTAADELATIPDRSGELSELNEHVDTVRDALEAATTALLATIDEFANVEREERMASEQLRISKRAEEFDRGLIELPQQVEIAEQAATAVVRLQATQTDLRRRITEETEHLEAVRLDGADAECPRCKRRYGDDYTPILDRLASAVDALTAQATTVEQELAAADQARQAADARLASLRAIEHERSTLTPIGPNDQLDEQLEQLRARGDELASRRLLLEQERSELQEPLDELGGRLSAVSASETERQARVQRLEQAQAQARFLDQQVAGVGSDEYQPTEHELVQQHLTTAEQAERECTALRAQADQLQVLEHRYQRGVVQAAETAAEAARLAAEAAAVTVEPEAVAAAEDEDREAETASQTASEAVHLAEREALREDAAVQSARDKLTRAQEEARRIKALRRELRYREALRAAFDDYRADASRRALPNLEQETASLLAAVTRGRYTDVRLSDAYSLELSESGQPHPLRRFSGGEQDIANLCLRLALSRALARQRGIETGFVILDEILGSQDIDRRAAVMGELRELLRDFRQIFVVSHFDDIADQCDLHIRVSRGGDAAAAELHR